VCECANIKPNFLQRLEVVDNQPQEIFPFNQSKERWSMYMLKKEVISSMYWNMILKGKAYSCFMVHGFTFLMPEFFVKGSIYECQRSD